MRILVVDDDPGVRESLRRSLAFNGYEVELAEDGQKALTCIALRRPDAVVLDVMMPGLDGLETCRRLRAAGEDLPVLMLTAREAVSDRVSGLDAGADDYLVKPFALEELLARLRALLRRAPGGPDASQQLRFSDLTLDLGTREVWRGPRAITLTRTEFHLLELLMRHPRQVLERGQILEEVWGYDFPTTANSLEVYVGYLRRKLEADAEPRLIHTVRGVGYSLRERIALLVVVAVGLLVTLASIAAYLTMRVQLSNQVDASLRSRAATAAALQLTPAVILNEPAALVVLTADENKAFLVDAQGLVSAATRDAAFRAALSSGPEVAVAQGTKQQSVRSVTVSGVQYRVLAVPSGPGFALVLARSMAATASTLERLGVVLLAVGLVGIGIAAAAGLAIAHAGLRPVERLTAAAERVARTGDFAPIEVERDDELGRLARTFNAMLAALDVSQTRQRQLVADAGHELRTPLTSLRTNLDLLAQSDAAGERGLSAADRRVLLADVRAQAEELSGLVADLVELARDDAQTSVAEELDLAVVAERAIERVRRRAANIDFDVHLEPWILVGDTSALERAITNLLDNAVKWSPPGGHVCVGLRQGRLSVEDQGPGIAPDDLPHVFDRFYRSTDARGMPGSGLGLAIVRQAAERHAGSVSAGRAESGGALMVLELPGRPLSAVTVS